MKTCLLTLALLMSSLSVGLQLMNVHPAPLFDKYLTPARISDFDYRRMLADAEMIRDSHVMSEGVGLPHVLELSDDHQRIICRVFVSEEDLPKTHDEQKRVLEQTGHMAVGDVASAFQLGDLADKQTLHAVKVEFWSIEAKKGFTIYAEFADGQLTFH